MGKVNVVCLDRFGHEGNIYQVGALVSLEMDVAKKMAMDGRVKLYTGNNGIFDNVVPKVRVQRPTLVIDIKPVTITGSFYR